MFQIGLISTVKTDEAFNAVAVTSYVHSFFTTKLSSMFRFLYLEVAGFSLQKET